MAFLSLLGECLEPNYKDYAGIKYSSYINTMSRLVFSNLIDLDLIKDTNLK